jgi:RHS repeat-associated protein
MYNEGSEMNTTTAMYDLPYRNYDAALGRFFQVDPLAHKSVDLSPYHYAGNNPVVFTDPSGLEKLLPIPLNSTGNAPDPGGGIGIPWWTSVARGSGSDYSDSQIGRVDNVSDGVFIPTQTLVLIQASQFIDI